MIIWGVDSGCISILVLSHFFISVTRQCYLWTPFYLLAHSSSMWCTNFQVIFKSELKQVFYSLNSNDFKCFSNKKINPRNMWITPCMLLFRRLFSNNTNLYILKRNMLLLLGPWFKLCVFLLQQVCDTEPLCRGRPDAASFPDLHHPVPHRGCSPVLELLFRC